MEFSDKDYLGVMVERDEPGYYDIWIQADQIKIKAKYGASPSRIAIKQINHANTLEQPHLKPEELQMALSRTLDTFSIWDD